MRSGAKLVALLIGVGMVAASCSLAGSSGEPAGSSSVAPSSSPGGVRVPSSEDLARVCADPVGALAERGLVDPAVVERVLGDAAGSVSGVDGAEGLVGVGSSVGLCGVGVSASVQGVLDEVERAAEAGDAEKAKRLLDELVASGLSALAPPGGGILAAAGDRDHRRAALDAMAVAAWAERMGDEETRGEAWGIARDEFVSYLEGDGDQPGAIEEAAKAKDVLGLLQLAAQATLMGLEELGQEVLGKALAIMEAELEKLLKTFDPCTASDEEIQRLGRTAARAALLGDSDEAGPAYTAGNLVQDTLELRAYRKAGIPVPADEDLPECDRAAAFSASGASTVEGQPVEVTATMQTCDGTTWTGTYEHRIVDPAGARGAIVASADVTVMLPDTSGTASAPVVFDVEGSLVYDAGQVQGTFTYRGEGSGTVTLTVDRDAETASLVVDGPPMVVTETVTAGGSTETDPFEHPGAGAELQAQLETLGPCG